MSALADWALPSCLRFLLALLQHLRHWCVLPLIRGSCLASRAVRTERQLPERPRNVLTQPLADAGPLPLLPSVFGAVGGAAWYLTRLARGTEVVWDKKNNPHPWQHVKENQQVKLFAVNHKYDGEPSVLFSLSPCSAHGGTWPHTRHGLGSDDVSVREEFGALAHQSTRRSAFCCHPDTWRPVDTGHERGVLLCRAAYT
jgi:NADH dehydrogenase (ubiquinone) 1 alpha subcomplex subunit 4